MTDAARAKAKGIVDQWWYDDPDNRVFARPRLVQMIFEALDAFAAERERAVWEEAARKVENSADEEIARINSGYDPGLTDRMEPIVRSWCRVLATTLRVQADDVKDIPHAGTLISRAEAKRISEDGP